MYQLFISLLVYYCRLYVYIIRPIYFNITPLAKKYNCCSGCYMYIDYFAVKLNFMYECSYMRRHVGAYMLRYFQICNGVLYWPIFMYGCPTYVRLYIYIFTDKNLFQ